MKRTLPMLAALSAAALVQSCKTASEAPKATAPPAAKVENRVKESDLTRVTLTAEAGKRLGIQLAPALDSELSAQASVAGEVVPIPGKALMVTAPVAGTLVLSKGALAAGQNIRKGEAVFRLIPLTGVQRDLRVTLEAELKAAKARLDAASQQLQRARQLLRDLAGSQRSVEAAEQEFNQAKAVHDASAERIQQVNSRPLDADVQMTISAPESGMIRQVQAAGGQVVAAGSALFEVVDLSVVWLRVPVYAGDLETFRPASVRVQNVDGKGPVRTASRVAAPPTADALSITADLYFALPNPDGELRPGQRLSVALPARPRVRKSVMVPTGAILYDIQGGTWVYVSESANVYRRQRVELAETQGGAAYLTRGLSPGARVVTAGAAELFGTEFGAGK